MKTSEKIVDPFHRTAEQIRSFINVIEAVYMFDRPREAGTERRAVERMNVTMPMRITPLDNELRPLDYHYHAITRDISSKGLGLVATSPVGHDYVLLTLEPYQSKPFNVIAKVVYCNDYGYYFHAGCEFLTS